jgi:hypothetical protein
MTLDLNTIYKAILETGWLITDEQGMVFRNLSVSNEEKEPFIMLEKSVALPTRENLNRSGRDNLLIFHPLMEGLLGGESPVIGKLRRAYGIRFSYALGQLFSSLLGGVTHATEYNKFSPEQMDLLTTIKNVDEGTLKIWDKLMALSMEAHSMSNSLVDVYIKRDVTVGDTAYSRFANVRFPIYDQLVNNPDKVFGSKMKIPPKDREVIIKLFEYMFPNIGLKDSYSVGTKSRIAPYLDTLLGVYAKLFTITNTIFEKFQDVVVFDPAIKVELAWPEWFRDIESLKNLAQSVPQQYGNYPVKVEDEKRAETGTNMQAHQAVLPQQSIALPQAQHQQIQQAANTPQQIGHPTVSIPQAPAAPQKFQGIGVPISGANGVVGQKQVSTQAVFVEGGAAHRANVDPMVATVHDAMKIAQSGGVGRVSATAARAVQQPMQNVNVYGQPVIQNQPLNGQVMNNNGWSTNNSNGFGQAQPSVAAAALLRQAALQNLMSNNHAFHSNNGFQAHSVI